jgi:aarF domain-containing kinase
MRIVQANNQHMGSPVNRIKSMGNWASRSLFQDPNLPLRERFQNAWRHVIFKTVMAASDIVFYFFQIRQLFGMGGGMEDEMEAHMKGMAKEFGVELQHDPFEG